MVDRALITTADECTWPENKSKPVLFLGEWCKRYSRKHIWQELDYEVAPYHWDDRQKLYDDYKYLRLVYDDLLLELSNKLNNIHSVNYSTRYWMILVGPWLMCFVQMVFDRWFMLKQVIDKNDSLEYIVLENDKQSFIPNDMHDFIRLFVSDEWNDMIYAQLVELSFKDSLNIGFQHEESASFIRGKNNTSLLQNIKIALKRKINVISSCWNAFFFKSKSYFFISTYLPKADEVKLKFHLGQFPDFWDKQPIANTTPKPQERQWLFCMEELEGDSFEYVIRKLIPLHIPTTYLEGYAKLKVDTDKICWPKKPKAIFTSNSYSSDDFFKMWAAGKTEENVPLVIGQHGGNHCMTPFSSFDDHQFSIADAWLSWGWRDCTIPQIYPVGMLSYKRKCQHNKEGNALMVEMDCPRYSYFIYTSIISKQWLSYFNDQQEFLRVLPKELRKQVVLRLKKNDHGWDQVDRWQDVMPEVELDLGNEDIYEQIKKCRIYISTYNATTYLESLSMNIPTIIFWDPRYWELKEEVKPYFDLLKSVGIFYETPTGAANQMIKVWDNVTAWWESDEVQNARKQFIYEFARTPDDLVHDLKLFFENLDSNIMIARN